MRNCIGYLKKHRCARSLAYLLAILLVAQICLLLLFQPSHAREWELGQEALPYIAIDADNNIEITNFRNFDWQKEGETSPVYETRNYNLDQLETVDVLISHFSEFEGMAHIFLSFGFSDGEHVVVSVETRRELGEKFSPVLGILRQFEIIYVVGSEQDIIGVRTDVRENERVYLYSTKAGPEQAQDLFLKITEDINDVYQNPRMYNTLKNNCTNEITRRVEDISDVRFPLTWKTILPGYFDEVLYEMQLIQSDIPFAEVKDRHFIDNSKVNRYDETYSADLRSHLLIDSTEE